MIKLNFKTRLHKNLKTKVHKQRLKIVLKGIQQIPQETNHKKLKIKVHKQRLKIVLKGIQQKLQNTLHQNHLQNRQIKTLILKVLV